MIKVKDSLSGTSTTILNPIRIVIYGSIQSQGSVKL